MPAVNLLDTFGKRVRILRTDVGMTQNELVDTLERFGSPVGRSYLSAIETTDRTPTGDVIAGIAKAIGTTSDYLLGMTENPFPPANHDSAKLSQSEDFLSPDAMELAMLFDKLPQWRRSQVIRTVRNIITAEVEQQSSLAVRSRHMLDEIEERYGKDAKQKAREILMLD